MDAIPLLSELGTGNEVAIEALAKKLRNTDSDNYNTWEIIKALLKIDPENQIAISALITCINNQAYHSREAVKWVKKNGVSNQTLIKSLTNLVQKLEHCNRNSLEIIELLAEIDAGNEIAINCLINWLKHYQVKNYLETKIIDLLFKLDSDNAFAIQRIISSIENTDNTEEQYDLINNLLLKISPNNPKARNILISWLEKYLKSDHFYVSRETIEWLGQVESGNQPAIDILTNLLDKIETNEDTYTYLIEALGKLGLQNDEVINKLAAIVKDSNHEYANRIQAIRSLGNIGLRKYNAINAVIFWIKDSETDEFDYNEAIEALQKIAFENNDAINILAKLIDNDEIFEDVQFQAIEVLGNIAKGSQYAINSIASYLEKREIDWSSRLYEFRREIEALEKIGSDNEIAISAVALLLQHLDPDDCLNTYDEKDSEELRITIESLIKIGARKPKIIDYTASLFKGIDTRGEKDARKAIRLLLEIDPEKYRAVDVLSSLIQNTEKFKVTRMVAIETLGEIGLGNPTAIEALASLILKQDHLYSYHKISVEKVIELLWKIDTNKQTAINTLTSILRNSENYERYTKLAIKWLVTTNEGKQKAIEAMIDFIAQSEIASHEAQKAFELLIRIAPDSEEVIKTVVSWLNNSDADENDRNDIIKSWTKSAYKNQDAIANLITIIKIQDNNYQLFYPAFLLWKIYPGNQKALDIFLELMQQPETHPDIHSIIVESFQEIQNQKILTQQQFQEIVSILKDSFINNNSESEQQYDNLYQILWYCTQNLSYPDFYRAWYPEDFNYAEFPQLLHNAVHSESITPSPQIVFIDGDKFRNSDNPCKKIYREMCKTGCPKSEDAQPETMEELEYYWEDITEDSNNNITLIFYETPAQGIYKGFSSIFLNYLTKFQGKICFVTPYSVDTSLKQFSTNQPKAKLIENILEWMKETE